MPMPLMSQAWVTGRDVAKRTLFVRLPSTQGTGIPVSVGYHGPADDIRVDQRPLPRIGTMGLVAFPYGDARNGIWVQSLYAAGNDATMPNGDGRLRTEWTGEVEYMSDDGDFYHRFPDGSYFTLGSSTDIPEITRRVVGSNQLYENVPAPDSLRRSGDVASKPFQFVHSSGTAVNIASDGTVEVSTKARDIRLTNSTDTVRITGGSIVLDTAMVQATGNLQVGNGVTGTFVTNTGLTVTVRSGIITNIG